MVRTIIAKRGDKYKQGIHLWKPTQHELEDAKETAYRDGFKTIYVHGEIELPKQHTPRSQEISNHIREGRRLAKEQRERENKEFMERKKVMV